MGSITPDQYKMMLSRLEGNSLRAAGVPDDAVEDEVNDLHYPIIDFCKKAIPEIPYIWSRTDKAATIGKGTPDFSLFYKGKAYLFECKSKRGTVSPDQVVWKIKAEAQQFTVHVIRSMREFLEIIES